MEHTRKPMSHEELARRVDEMEDGEQAHFKHLIELLVHCYGTGKLHAVVVFGDAEHGAEGVMSLNCDEMGAAKLLIAANDFINYINVADAPPKEAFN